VNIVVLFVILTRRLGGPPDGGLLTSLIKLTLAAAVMGALLTYTRSLGAWELGLTSWNFLVLLAGVAGGLAVFVVSAYLLRSRELASLVRFVRGGGI
jgi:hypothetical protein